MRASPLALISARVRTKGQMLRGPVPSGRAAPALCHAHWPVLPAAISAVKTADRFGTIYVSLILLHCILHVYKSQGGHGDGPSNGETIDAVVTVEMNCVKDKISK